MKPKAFKLTDHERKYQKQRDNAQDRITDAFIRAMEDAMLKVMPQVLECFTQGVFKAPEIDLQQIGMDFYFNIIGSAVEISQKERGFITKKKLAALPKGLPKRIQFLDDVFGKRKYYTGLFKRTKVLTDRLKKQYFAKLKDGFDQMLPRITSGEITPAQAQEYMVEKWQVSKPRVRTIFRTEATNYFAKAQVSFFDGDDDIIGFLFDRVRDVATTDICNSRHGLIYRPGTKELTKNTPALHWNCRSHLIPLANTERNRKMLLDPDRDPKNRKVAPLPPGWSK